MAGVGGGRPVLVQRRRRIFARSRRQTVRPSGIAAPPADEPTGWLLQVRPASLSASTERRARVTAGRSARIASNASQWITYTRVSPLADTSRTSERWVSPVRRARAAASWVASSGCRQASTRARLAAGCCHVCTERMGRLGDREHGRNEETITVSSRRICSRSRSRETIRTAYGLVSVGALAGAAAARPSYRGWPPLRDFRPWRAGGSAHILGGIH